MASVFDEYLKYLREEKKFNKHSILCFKGDLNLFEGFLRGIAGKLPGAREDTRPVDQKILACTEEQILLYRTFLQENYARESVTRMLSSIRCFYKYLILHGQVNQNPVPIFRAAPKVPVLT